MTSRAVGPSGPILQKSLPVLPWMKPATSRLPGVQPLPVGDWLRTDECYAPQMALREDLIARRRDDVIAATAAGRESAEELLRQVVLALDDREEFDRQGDLVRCPDGRKVRFGQDDPLGTVGRLVQEDFCLLTKVGTEHLLQAAVLCFPASWTLGEKIGRPLAAVHAPVDSYDAGMAARVQRLFDAVRVHTPLWRANALLYDDPALFQPLPEDAPRPSPTVPAMFVRSELQTIRRLPVTGAIAFGIHTYVVGRHAISPEAMSRLEEITPPEAG